VEHDSSEGAPELASAVGDMRDELRCANCGGLVAAGAEWCGQCFAPLGTRPAGDERAPVAANGRASAAAASGGGAVEVIEGKATWDCPVCGDRNPIEASLCATCQTPFARLFEVPEDRHRIRPSTAALWSLAFAGLGHWKVGQRPDGIARIVLFAWTLGTVVIVLSSRSASGFGSTASLFVLYLGSASAIYVLSAVDAYRAAEGIPPIVSSKVLLWASAALVLASIALATLVTLPATRG
jgi:hypothetical protein